MKNSWYRFTARADEVDIFITDEIGLFGLTAKQFIDEFKRIKPTAKVNLHLNSPGGDVFDSIAIFNVIKRHKGVVEGTVDGLAASGASIIAMAPRTLRMPDNTFLMIHNASGMVIGNAENMEDWAEVLRKIDNSLVGIYVAKSGQTAEKIAELMSDETWLTAQEAKDLGLADEVLSPIKLAALANPSRFKNLPAALLSPQPAPIDSQSDFSTLPPAAKKAIQRARKWADEEREQAQAIAKACADAGRPDLTVFFLTKDYPVEAIRKYLTDPVRLTEVTSFTQSDQVKEIYAICNAAHVPDMAADFIGEGKSVEQVRQRLQYAGPINERCAAFAHRFGAGFDMRERAREFIKAGAKPEEVSNTLLRLLAAMDVGEIDNKLGPDLALGRSPRQTTQIDYQEIYSHRRPKASPTLGELKALLEYVR